MRSSRASSCSRASGVSASTLARTSSTSTSAIYGARSERLGSKRRGTWAIGSLSTRARNGNGVNGVKRLLLVEDEARVADFLVRGLSSPRVEVTLAEDGEVAQFLAATEQFD